MKKKIITVILIHLGVFCFGQVPRKSAEFSKTSIGFVFYWAEHFPAIVFVDADKNPLTYEDFCTSNLTFAYLLSYDGLGLDLKEMVKKYGKAYKLKDYVTDPLFLNIFPVEINYTVHEYEFSKEQFKELRNVDTFRLVNKNVCIKKYGRIPIHINSLKPLLGYH